MARGNGKDLVSILVHDIEALKMAARESNDEMEALSERMSSLSDTMSELAKSMGLMAKAMTKQAAKATDSEKLYGRLAKTLIAFKAQTDTRFDGLESRIGRLERIKH
jgi:hypothetical protein